jgi:Fe-Mn family superoxide dismutase
MKERCTRRDVLLGVLPAAAAGVGLGGVAMAQESGRRNGGGQGAPSLAEELAAQAYQNGRYVLPNLPYPYDAVEPHIDARTMQLHHARHHQSYVDGLNRAARELHNLRGGEIDATRLEALQRDLSFNGGGHVLHTLFWSVMAPRGGGQPQGAIARALNASFGSFDRFKQQFSRVATSLKGSGWAILAYEPFADSLLIFAAGDHDLNLVAGTQPILPLDLWEHAYYLRYQNARADYVRAWWNAVNWQAVGELYATARSRFRGGEPPAAGK